MATRKLNNSRCSYPFVHKPGKPASDTDTPKYQITAMVPKDSEEHKEIIESLRKEARELAIAKFGANPPKSLKGPIKDGDAEDCDKPEYKGHWIIGIRSGTKPGIVDQACRTVTDEQIPMPGDYVNVSFNMFAYDKGVNKGVTCGLNNVQFVGKGESLGNRRRAEDDFEPVEVNAEGAADFF